MNEEAVKVEEDVKEVISVTADSATSEESVRRNSTGKADLRTLPSLLSSDEKTIPHYLRASTKSCHDFCKYGKGHVFETKKRHPIRQSFPQSSSVQDEDRKAPEVSTLSERMKRSEMKANTTSRTKDGLSDKIISIKKIGPKEKESSDTSRCIKLQTPSLPNEGKESPEEFVSIRTTTPLPINHMEEFSDSFETTKLENSLPTEKRIISYGPTTPLACSEGSSGGSESMEPDSPSVHTSKDQLGKSFEEPLAEITSPSPGIDSMALTDEPVRSRSTTPPSMPESIKTESVKSQCFSREGRSSEKDSSVKLKTPSPNLKNSTACAKRTMSNNLRAVEAEKRDLTKPEVSDRAKAISKKKIELAKHPRIINKRSPSLVEKPKKIAEQKNLPIVKKVIMSVSPKIIKNKAPSSNNKITNASEPSISLKLKTPVAGSTPALISSRKPSYQIAMGDKIIRSEDLSKPRVSTNLPAGREKLWNQVKVVTPEHTNENEEKTAYIIDSKTLATLALDSKLTNKEPNNNRPYLSSHSRSSSSLSSSLPSSSVYSLSESKRNPPETDLKPTNKEPKKNKPYSSSYSRSSSSLSSSPSSSMSTASESKKSKAVISPKREEKTRPIRTATTHSEPKRPSPHKLKFQRGEIVSPKSENNAPRKLRFRQAQGKSETQNNKEAVRRGFVRRRRVSIGSRAEMTSPGVKAPAVVLKHQGVQEKKETQGLLNHVIEETASKLVETRKSKVKALVGAFETVFSLQETRVATTTL